MTVRARTSIGDDLNSSHLGTHVQTDGSQSAAFILAAVQDTQETIRAFDIKAEILAAFVALVILLAQWIVEDTSPPLIRGFGVLAGMTSIVSVWFLGMVVMPRIKHRPEINLGAYLPKDVFYPPVSTDPQLDVTEFARRARETDWVSELTFELFKLSRIRADKEAWFRKALRSAELAFILTTLCFLLNAVGS